MRENVLLGLLNASNEQDNALVGYINQSDLSKATFINYK